MINDFIYTQYKVYRDTIWTAQIQGGYRVQSTPPDSPN